MNHPQFGDLISKHRVHLFWTLSGLVPFVLFLVIMIISGPVVLPVISKLQQNDWLAALIELGITVLAVVYLSRIFWHLVRFPRVSIFEKGLIVKSSFSEQSWYWDEFTASSTTYMMRFSHTGIVNISLGEFRLYKGDEKAVAFNLNHTHFNELMSNITIQIDALLLPQYMKKFELYGEVDFDGKLAINKERVYDIKRPKSGLPLEDINNLFFDNSLLIVKSHQSGTARFQAMYVKNITVLAKMIAVLAGTEPVHRKQI
ncbi:MAG: hypothetical protein CL607_03875 [Anaerolineaceae bacterium]|nr:hypothetical protein [Anaerolineaceae bacterium]